MNRLFRSILLSIMLACSAFAVQANSTYSFEFLSTNYEVDGMLTVDGNNIIGISGIVWGNGGGNITGLVNNPNQPNPVASPYFQWDNVLPLNNNGVLFTFGVASIMNLFQEGQGYRIYSYNAEGPTGVVDAVGTFSATLNVAPVPEPETYAMMLAGLGLLGFASRRRRQQHLPSLPAMA